MPLPDAALRARAVLARRPQPWVPLAAILSAKLLLIVWLAGRAQHNGWLYYQGGDQSWYYTSAWVISDGHLPPAIVGYAWPLALAPLAAVAGPNFLAAVPALAVLEIALLVPLTVVCVYALAARVAGRGFGYWAAALWALAPFLAIPLFVERYHYTWIDVTLPQLHGLSALADFPSTVAVLAAAVFAVRTIDRGDRTDALLCGVLCGLAVGVKPSSAIFLAAPALGLAAARRWPGLAYAAAGALPAAVTLAVWKERGLGYLPLFSLPEVRLAAGTVVGALDPYIRLDWGRLGQNFDELREFFWSVRILQWAPLAGLVGVARSSIPKAVFLGTWLIAFLLLKGAAPEASVATGSFWRLMMPALPAYLILVAAVPLALPVVGPRLVRAAPTGRAVGRRAALAAVAVLAAVPLLAVAALPPIREGRTVQHTGQGVYIPEVAGWRVQARSTPSGVVVYWDRPPTANARVFYRVFRRNTPDFGFDGISCSGPGPGVAAQCFLEMEQIGNLSQLGTLTETPPSGWVFRVGVAADSRAAEDADLLFLSGPVFVTVPPGRR